MLQLGIQIGAVQQQVGTVQGQAVVDVEQAGRDHRDPGREISVVHVDVADSASLQLQRVAGAQQGVQQRACPARRRLAALRQHAQKNVRQQAALGAGRARQRG